MHHILVFRVFAIAIIKRAFIGDQILLPFGRSRLIYTVVEGDRPHGSLYINFKVINNETQEEEIETFRINERIDRLVDDESGNPV